MSDAVADLLLGFDTITADTGLPAIETMLRQLARNLTGADPLRRATIRQMVVERLKALEISAAARLVDAALEPGPTIPTATPTVQLADAEPWPEPVDGAALLTELTAWISSYVWISPVAATAAALWGTATWCVEHVDFAPILAVLSATKRCGKSHLLDLLRGVVRRGYLTSGSGVTTAVVFRLNNTQRPTLLIDEAEKLAGRHADRELIGMLNAGYRRGAQVQRCVERNGDFEVVAFDAFGFRALAAIGRLWDTILDRAITVRLERKPRDVTLRRFSSRVVETEAARLARRLARWAADSRTAVATALADTPRPDWLDDRACDNWAALLAVATVTGSDWPTVTLTAARTLSSAATVDAADDTERLVHDLRRLWDDEKWGAAVKSGDLTAKLNELEGSPWGDYAKGKGLTTHRLAAMCKPLGVGPRQDRDGTQVVRGYWRTDLEPVFRRYPPPEVVQLVQLVQEKPHHDLSVPLVPPVPVQAERAGPPRLMVEATKPGVYRVSGGAEPHVVEIMPGAGARCDCGDHQYRGRQRDCKHIVAVHEHQTPAGQALLDRLGLDETL